MTSPNGLGGAHHAHAAEDRQHRVLREEPAAEVARLHAHVDEQDEREDREHDSPHPIAARLDRRADQRERDRRPAETPREARQVVGDPALLRLPELRGVAGGLRLALDLGERPVGMDEEVRRGDRERDDEGESGEH